MQKLYSINVFLDNETLICLDKEFNKIRNQIYYYVFNGSDQSGAGFTVREVYISGISLIFLEANDYHKIHDFEIGFTYESLEEWIQFEKRIKNQNADYSIGEYDNTRYAVISEGNLHIPFYFIFDNKHSEKDSFSIEGLIKEKEYNFYNNELSNFIDENYSKNMNFQMNEDGIFQMRKIGIPIDKDSLSKIKYQNNEIIMEITSDEFSLNMK